MLVNLGGGLVFWCFLGVLGGVSVYFLNCKGRMEEFSLLWRELSWFFFFKKLFILGVFCFFVWW